MNEHRLPLTFSLDQDSPLDALEAVLAIARRGGVRLARLQVQHCTVALELRADDADLLALFRARLQNLFSVHDIALSESLTTAGDHLLVAC
jgi:hypothetical protein